MKKLKTLLATALLATATSTLVYANTSEQQFQQGLAAYDNGDYQIAFKLWKPLADEGNIDLQFSLAQMYRSGMGVTQNYQQAFQYYKKAAERGHIQAQYNLAMIYKSGLGIKQNDQQAFKWFQQAAEKGDVLAQSMLGVMYGLGQGVKKDSVRAKMWVGRACDNGHQDSCDMYRMLNKEK